MFDYLMFPQKDLFDEEVCFLMGRGGSPRRVIMLFRFTALDWLRINIQ